MSSIDEREGLNLPKTTLTEFFEDMEGKLSLLTGLVPYESFGLTLKDVRKPMLVIGLPGIGKTCGIISAIEKLNAHLPEEKHLGFKKILLGQTVVGSLTGIPVAMPNGEVVRVQLPDLPNPEKDGQYGVLFLDEITTADEMQIQPALGLADDSRCLGEYTLPEHWIVVGAGNGPDCTNFVRLDDMTISRFATYDISYDYKKDFRPYAHATGISSDIIAFLNFDPSSCVKVESTEADSAGKMFPCPRTWERLSIELKMREALGKPVPIDNMANFAGRIIGIKTGRKLEAFLTYKKNSKYSVEKILAGTEIDPEMDMKKEVFHILLQGIIKNCSEELKRTNDGCNNFPLATYQMVANGVSWLFKIYELDLRINAILEICNEVPVFSSIMTDSDFMAMCPEMETFFDENAELILRLDNNELKF